MTDMTTVVSTYKALVNACHPAPVAALAKALHVSIATAHRRLVDARQAGLLPDRTHEPRRARAGGDTWLACRTCRIPWPCPPGAEAYG